ncbi:sensor histidine kinase [Anaerosporobacter sp.]|uniref:sensor histidine kinase n=1 Tax=Anaerosporobacter sp. TaxID=1872529 RepID=UPI00286F9CCB|nr:histidine kinase [Anaerosporobacter sp.]
MRPIFYVNIALEIFGAATSLLVIICMAVGRFQKTKLDKIFIWLLVSNILVLLSDATAISLKGNTSFVAGVFIRIANFCVYSFGYLILAVFAVYLMSFLGTKTPVSHTLTKLVCGGCAIAVLLVVISQFNHMYYRFDENNVYIRGEWFWLSQVLPILCMLLNSVVIFRFRRFLDLREKMFLSAYIVLPIMAMVIQIMVYGLALLYIVTSLSVFLIYLGIQVDQGQQAKQKEAELTEAYISVMLSQMQPHFLYNSLASIEYLCHIGESDQAATAVRDFSKYLRGNMESVTNKKCIPFEKELQHTNLYLSLEKRRFDDLIQTSYDIQVMNFALPPLTLQPIVENAVKHGITKRKNGGLITIHTKEDESFWHILVTDTGIGFDINAELEDGRTHVGIANVRSRLKMLCDGQLIIESTPDVGTTAIILIPKKTGGTVS